MGVNTMTLMPSCHVVVKVMNWIVKLNLFARDLAFETVTVAVRLLMRLILLHCRGEPSHTQRPMLLTQEAFCDETQYLLDNMCPFS